MDRLYIYLPAPTERGGLTATELLYAQMPCYHGRRDFLTDPGELPSTCVVCGDTLGNDTSYRRLPCSHIFHQPCIDCWLREQDASCPICRRTFYYLRGLRLLRVASPATMNPALPDKSYLRIMKSWVSRKLSVRQNSTG